ncbi:hypothetical protein [Streptomyces sp. ALI-76-A]|jgi:DNA-binding PucR family transcriptional regulator|uniref:hypothetical protein n=1 Tax=Streptomyces sp. ALI-76-A TaxID=3025736 RepID=UPI00256ED0AD|nr:hypothetical protein [Streptomyces sp. ALI-76-A]MDL5205360.1 hypothetical protein [Streptomyces sp. ALI-76-A]
MSALPHETPARSYADAYRLEAGEGPQTLAELRAALAAIDPVELVAFNARLEAARFGAAQNEVIAEARHLVALRTRPEVAAAIEASLAGASQSRPVNELWEHLDSKGVA